MSQTAWMADSTGAIFWFNQRWFEYTGSTPEQMVGHGWQEVHHPDFLEHVVSKYYDCIRAGSDWEDTFPLLGKDGQFHWFLSRAVPIRNENGQITRWFGTNTDVTEFRKIEAELRQAQQLAEVANKARVTSLQT